MLKGSGLLLEDMHEHIHPTKPSTTQVHPLRVLSLGVVLLIVLGACGGATATPNNATCEWRDARACTDATCFSFRYTTMEKRFASGASLCRTRCSGTCVRGTCRALSFESQVGPNVEPLIMEERVCISDGEVLS